MSTRYSNDPAPIVARYCGSAALLAAIRAAATLAPELAPHVEFPGRYLVQGYPHYEPAQHEIGSPFYIGPFSQTGRECILSEAPACVYPRLNRHPEAHGPLLPMREDSRVSFHYSASGARGSLTCANLRPDLLRMADRIHANRAVFDGTVKRARCPVAVAGSKGSAPHVAARALWAAREYVDALQLAQNVGAVFFGKGPDGKPPIAYMSAEHVRAAAEDWVIARRIDSGSFYALHLDCAVSLGEPCKTAAAALDALETRTAEPDFAPKMAAARVKHGTFSQSAALAHYMGADETAPEARADGMETAPARAAEALAPVALETAPRVPAAVSIVSPDEFDRAAELLRARADAEDLARRALIDAARTLERITILYPSDGARSAVISAGKTGAPEARAAVFRALSFEADNPRGGIGRKQAHEALSGLQAVDIARRSAVDAERAAQDARMAAAEVSRAALADLARADAPPTRETTNPADLHQIANPGPVPVNSAPEAPALEYVSHWLGGKCEGLSEVSAKIERARFARDEPGFVFKVAPANGAGLAAWQIGAMRGKFEVQRWRAVAPVESVDPVPGKLEAKPAAPDWFASILAKSEERKARAQALADGAEFREIDGGSVRLAHADGERYGIAGPCMSTPGRFRFTHFDARGPVGDMGFACLADAIGEALTMGYAPVQAGAADPAGLAIEPAAADPVPAKPEKATPYRGYDATRAAVYRAHLETAKHSRAIDPGFVGMLRRPRSPGFMADFLAPEVRAHRDAMAAAVRADRRLRASVAAAPISAKPETPRVVSVSASWVIREKATGAVIMETFDRRKVDALNTAKYEAVPIIEHLAGLSRRDPVPEVSPPTGELKATPAARLAANRPKRAKLTPQALRTFATDEADEAAARPVPAGDVDAARVYGAEEWADWLRVPAAAPVSPTRESEPAADVAESQVIAWKMTRDAYAVASGGETGETHRASVSRAIAAGRDVPADVLAEHSAGLREDLRRVESRILAAVPARFSNGQHGSDIEAACAHRAAPASLKHQRADLRAAIRRAGLAAIYSPAPAAPAADPGRVRLILHNVLVPLQNAAPDGVPTVAGLESEARRIDASADSMADYADPQGVANYREVARSLRELADTERARLAPVPGEPEPVHVAAWPAPVARAYMAGRAAQHRKPAPYLRIPAGDLRGRIPARFAPCYVLQA